MTIYFKNRATARTFAKSIAVKSPSEKSERGWGVNVKRK